MPKNTLAIHIRRKVLGDNLLQVSDYIAIHIVVARPWGLIGNVVPNMGQTYIVDSFLVVVTGGVGKLAGTIMAGLGVGLVNKILEPIFEAVYSKVLILGLIILFLQSRPTGIFPAKGRDEDT